MFHTIRKPWLKFHEKMEVILQDSTNDKTHSTPAWTPLLFLPLALSDDGNQALSPPYRNYRL